MQFPLELAILECPFQNHSQGILGDGFSQTIVDGFSYYCKICPLAMIFLTSSSMTKGGQRQKDNSNNIVDSISIVDCCLVSKHLMNYFCRVIL